MFEQLADHSNVNAPANAGRTPAPVTAERHDRLRSAYDLIAAAARSATLEYSDCVSRNNSTSEANLQTPPPENSRACSQQADCGEATRSPLRSPVFPDANTVLNGRRRRAETGTSGFPECFTELRADECFGWLR
jgi:hypothetical protein